MRTIGIARATLKIGRATYACAQLTNLAEITGGSPYGAGTLAGPDGSRQPSENELLIAEFQGAHVAKIARQMYG